MSVASIGTGTVSYEDTVEIYTVVLPVAGEFRYRTPTLPQWRTAAATEARCTVRLRGHREAWVSFIQLRGEDDSYLNLDTHAAIYYDDTYRQLAVDAVAALSASTGYQPVHRMA